MTFRMFILASVLLTLVACSSGAEEASSTPTVTVTATATATATETVTATPEPPPEPEEPAAVGETVELEDLSVTLHDIDLDPAPEPGPQPSGESDKWVSADVELCSDTLDGYFSSRQWALVDTENRNFSSSNTGYNSFPEPSFAFGDEQISPGECRRGWITFVVNKDSNLSSLRYDGSSFQDPEGQSVSWSLDS